MIVNLICVCRLNPPPPSHVASLRPATIKAATRSSLLLLIKTPPSIKNFRIVIYSNLFCSCQDPESLFVLLNSSLILLYLNLRGAECK